MKESSVISAAVAFALGIGFAGLTSWPLTVFYGLLGFLLVLGAIALATGRIRYVLLCLIAVFFLAGAVRLIHAEVVSPSDISHFAGKTVTVAATVTDGPQVVMVDANTQKIRYTVEANYVSMQQGLPQAASGKLIAVIRQNAAAPQAHYGDTITFTAKIAEPHNYNNPGAYDFAAALKRQGITARATIIGARLAITEKGDDNWRDYITALRGNFKAAMQAVMSPEQAAILFGTLFGGYDDIPKTVVKDFATTGIVHILSVSGTHIALVAGVMLWLGQAVGAGRVTTAVAAGSAVLFYGLLAGFTPPVLRSAAMGIISLAAVALGREKDARTALAVSAFAMLVFTPGLLYDLSFQLSFAATAGLVLLYPSILKRLGTKLPVWLAAGLAVTLAAQLSVLPILSWYFNSLSLSSFAANIVLVPAFEAVVVAGLAGTLLAAVWPVGGSVILACCGVAISAIVFLTSAFAALPGSAVYLPPFGLAVAAVYYLLLLWYLGYKPSYMPDLASLLRRRRKIMVSLLAGIVASCLVYTYWPRPVAVHFIDVGQGDAALVTTPHGRAILIDTGGASAESGFDIGDRVVVPYLKHYGILSLDYLMLTHGHQDHAGGAASIAAAMPVKSVFLANEPHSAAVSSLIAVKSSKLFIPAYEGQRVVLDGVTLEVDHAAVGSESKGRGGNEASTVIRVSYGGHSFLVTGDLTAAEEQSMVSKGLGHATVLKVAHHGAKSSTTQEFLQAVSPAFAVISAGYNNRYGHPHRETLQRLEASGVPYFRTDLQGAVVFRTDGLKLTVETFRQ